jgi:mRNA interferase HigB
MHIISRKALADFWEKHPDSKEALIRWYRIVERSTFAGFAELRQTFPSADMVGRYTVFNLGGNKFRLITSIHYDRGKVYVRNVLTHQEYDQEKWKK